ncbi:hypothetical protein FQZ97_1221410 [compost metagenome]
MPNPASTMRTSAGKLSTRTFSTSALPFLPAASPTRRSSAPVWWMPTIGWSITVLKAISLRGWIWAANG